MPDQIQQPESTTATPTNDYDSPWKESLELYFPQALALLTPDLYAAIDWSVSPTFLDKELQSIDQRSKHGRRFVDKLARVRLLGGVELRLLIHVEVQGALSGPKIRQGFARRMYEYHHLIQTHEWRMRRSDPPPPVYSLGIVLNGHGPEGRLTYSDEYLGLGVRFACRVVELNRWRLRWTELESQAYVNPFSVVIMAQLQANLHPDKRTRVQPKFELVRRLRRYGYDDTQTRQIYRLVDWLITLPEDLEPIFVQAVETLSEGEKMTYLTTAERLGIKKGMQVGRAEGQADLLLRQIARRFGPASDETTQRIRAASTTQLELWSLNFVDAATLDDVFRD
ncbi:DUF4351 domain-containing protein [Castellaniella sp. MT123]|uniref:DUF4351 domain-containing protein n=1 Tax=Castellaniella sp. MT123 TaxID=3140381 RepID=UPI0031F3472C